MEKKGVYMLIKMLFKEENKMMQERVDFFFFNTSVLDEIREDVTPSLTEAHLELSLGQ